MKNRLYAQQTPFYWIQEKIDPATPFPCDFEGLQFPPCLLNKYLIFGQNLHLIAMVNLKYQRG